MTPFLFLAMLLPAAGQAKDDMDFFSDPVHLCSLLTSEGMGRGQWVKAADDSVCIKSIDIGEPAPKPDGNPTMVTYSVARKGERATAITLQIDLQNPATMPQALEKLKSAFAALLKELAIPYSKELQTAVDSNKSMFINEPFGQIAFLHKDEYGNPTEVSIVIMPKE